MATVKAKVRVAGSNSNVAPSSATLIPAHIRETSSGIVDLLDAYYKWADLPGNYQGDAKRLLEYADRDLTNSDFVEFIKAMFLRLFPDKTEASMRLLLSFAKDFYSKRGTFNAYKFLFRSLYDEDVELYFPSQYIMKSSDGVWVTNSILKCLGSDVNMKDVVGRRLWGVSSGASALVKSVIFYAAGTDIVAELTVSDVVGTLVPDEVLVTRDDQVEIKSRVFGQIGSYTISNSGKGYLQGAVINIINHNGGSGLIAKIGAVDDEGAILTIEILSSGIGYTIDQNPVIDMSDIALFDPALLISETASVSLSASAKYTTPGEYTTLKSAVSNSFKLQDGSYYQEFSYVLKTNVPLSTFEAPVTSLVHPAGMTMFAQPDLTVDLSGSINNTGSMIYQYSKPEGINFVNINADSGRKYFDIVINTSNPSVSYVHGSSNYTRIGLYISSSADRIVELNEDARWNLILIDKAFKLPAKYTVNDKVLSWKNTYSSYAEINSTYTCIGVNKTATVTTLDSVALYEIAFSNINSSHASSSQFYEIIYSGLYGSRATLELANLEVGLSLYSKTPTANVDVFNIELLLNKILSMLLVARTPTYNLLSDTGSSATLDYVGNIVLDDLMPFRYFYGLSPQSVYSNVELTV